VRSLADEVPFDIPNSWEWVRLGSIVYNRGQISPSTDFCYIDIGSIDNKKQKLNPTDTVIAPDKAPSRARKLVDKGDVLYSTVRPYLHNMCIVDRDFSCIPIASTGFAVLTCHAELCNKFLFYYMMSPDFDAYANNTDNAKGVAYPAINDDRLYKALIPIPPLGEQFRIVSAIESVDASIRDYGAKEEALRALNGSFPERLKKSILQEAVQGKLVPQDPSDEPAGALLERIRAEKQRLIKEGKIKKDKHESVIFRRDNSHYEKRGSEEVCIDDELPFDIPSTWMWSRLSSIVTVLGDGIHGTPVYSANGTTAFINGNNLQDGKIVIKPDTKRVTDEEASKHKRCLTKDTVLLSINGTIGNVAFYDGEHVILGKSACYFNLLSGVSKEYVRLVLETDYFEKYAVSVATGTTIKNVPLAGMRNLLVPIPPTAEQAKIVQAVALALNLVAAL
jgi:type I restriction enzyme S subunit